METSVTPHRVSLCALVAVLVRPPKWEAGAPPPSTRQQLTLYLLTETKAPQGYLEPALGNLLQHLQQALGEEFAQLVAEEMLERLEGIQSPDGLHIFFNELRAMVGGDGMPPPEVGLHTGVHPQWEALMLEPSSPLGLFLRRCLVAFESLPFEGTCRLFSEIHAYCEPQPADSASPRCEGRGGCPGSALTSQTQMQLSTPGSSSSSPAMSMASMASATPKSGRRMGTGLSAPRTVQDEHPDLGLLPVLTQDRRNFCRQAPAVGAWLQQQAAQVQRRVGRFPASELAKQLNHLLMLDPEQSKAHFVHYLNQLQHDHFPASVDSLHRYFDYRSTQKLQTSSSTNTNGSGAESGPGGASAGTGGPVGRGQTALLHLGEAHARLGHVPNALHALNETVRCAQQSGDDTCLAHALAALCRLLLHSSTAAEWAGGGTGEGASAHGRGDHEARAMHRHRQLLLLLARCAQRAKDLNLPHLMAYSQLALAQFTSSHLITASLPASSSYEGDASRMILSSLPQDGGRPGVVSDGPVRMSQAVRASVNLHYAARVSAAAPGAADAANNTPPGMASGMAAMVAMGRSMGRRGGAVELFGSPGAGQIVTGATTEHADAVAQLLGNALLLRGACWQTYGCSALASASALAHLYSYGDVAATEDTALAYAQLVVQASQGGGGRGEEFAALLRQGVANLPLPAGRQLRRAALVTAHRCALHAGHLPACQEASAYLAALSHPSQEVDMESRVEAAEALVETLLESGLLAEAACLATKLFDTCLHAGMQMHHVRMLLLLAQIHQVAGSPVTALPYVLSCRSLCTGLHMELANALATTVLAELSLELGSCGVAGILSMLRGVMPLVLGQGSIALKARTNIAFAKCLLRRVNPQYLSENPDVVLRPLAAALDGYKAIASLSRQAEVLYLQAMIFDSLGRMAERDAAAADFLQCEHVVNL